MRRAREAILIVKVQGVTAENAKLRCVEREGECDGIEECAVGWTGVVGWTRVWCDGGVCGGVEQGVVRWWRVWCD